jgi:hypothetical protein
MALRTASHCNAPLRCAAPRIAMPRTATHLPIAARRRTAQRIATRRASPQRNANP